MHILAVRPTLPAQKHLVCWYAARQTLHPAHQITVAFRTQSFLHSHLVKLLDIRCNSTFFCSVVRQATQCGGLHQCSFIPCSFHCIILRFCSAVFVHGAMRLEACIHAQTQSFCFTVLFCVFAAPYLFMKQLRVGARIRAQDAKILLLQDAKSASSNCLALVASAAIQVHR